MGLFSDMLGSFYESRTGTAAPDDENGMTDYQPPVATSDGDDEFVVPDDLAQTLFTQILRDDDYHLETQKYARPFAPGLVQVLIIDTPYTTEYVADHQLKEFQFFLGQKDIDGLFRFAQANTDAVALSQVDDLGSGFFEVLGGESVVTAAKLGNIPKLCSDLGIPTEGGMAFLPLHSSYIVLGPHSEENYNLLNEFDWTDVPEGGALTDAYYVWRSDDGAIMRWADEEVTFPWSPAQNANDAPTPAATTSSQSATGHAARPVSDSIHAEILHDVETTTNPGVLGVYSIYSDADVRLRVAVNENTPAKVLEILANDPEPRVRLAVALHNNTPVEIIRKIEVQPQIVELLKLIQR